MLIHTHTHTIESGEGIININLREKERERGCPVGADLKRATAIAPEQQICTKSCVKDAYL